MMQCWGQFREIKKSLILEGKIFSWDFLMTTVLFRLFVGIWENHFGLAQVYDYTVKMSSQIFFFKIQNQNIFLGKKHDGRNLIFDHKLHIGMPYRGKRFWNHQIPTSCLPT
jgi:hypothetical protein